MFELDEALQKYITKPDPLGKPELAMLYSQPGGGKTHLAATSSEIPGVKKVLYLDAEGSTVGVLSNFNEKKIDVIRLDQMEDRGIKLFNTIISKLEAGETEYDVVVVDPVDKLQDSQLSLFQARTSDGYEAYRQLKDWTEHLVEVLKRIAPFCIVVIHEREEKLDSGGIISRLRLAGQSKDTVPGIPDMVLYLTRALDEDGTGHTYASTGFDKRAIVKNRFGLPPVVKDVNFPAIWKFIDNKAKTKEEVK